MGIFIETKDCTREVWLQSFATELSAVPATLSDTIEDEEWLLVWVDNGLFKAVGVIYSQMELERVLYALNNPEDTRPMKFFIAMDEDIKEVVSERDYEFITNIRSANDGS